MTTRPKTQHTTEDALAERLWDAGLRAEHAGPAATGLLADEPTGVGWAYTQLAPGVVLWCHLDHEAST